MPQRNSWRNLPWVNSLSEYRHPALINPSHGSDNDILNRDVAGPGEDHANLIHDVHAADDLAEYGITPGILGVGFVEEVVVLDVNEKLRGGAVRIIISPRHGNGAAFIG